jgi:hypothetical protein
VGLLAVDEHRLPVQPDPGVHRLGDDALVLPDLHRPAVDADRLVRLGRRLRPLVDDPDGDAAAGQLQGVGQPGRAGAGHQHLDVPADGPRRGRHRHRGGGVLGTRRLDELLHRRAGHRRRLDRGGHPRRRRRRGGHHRLRGGGPGRRRGERPAAAVGVHGPVPDLEVLAGELHRQPADQR